MIFSYVIIELTIRYLDQGGISSLQYICKDVYNLFMQHWMQKCKLKYARRVYELFSTIQADKDLYKQYR